MKKKIIFGSLFSIFLLLMIPSVSVISKSQDNNIAGFNYSVNKKDRIEKIFVTQISVLLPRVKNLHPEIYNEINEKINYLKNEDDELDLCLITCFIYGICIAAIIGSLGLAAIGCWPFILISLLIAHYLDCQWLDDLPKPPLD